MVSINELLKKSKIDFKESILILCKLLDVDKSYIFTYGDRQLPVSIAKDFLYLTEKRKKAYPLQYILGERHFMGIDFFLEEGVLIPREDTEVLVEFLIDYVRREYGEEEEVRILDLGFGSGAISISLAYHLDNARVYGVDISEEAYRIANINKERLSLENVDFYRGDLFKALKEKNIQEKFHIIVSNPPYIESETIETLDIGVKDYEPRMALDGGEDGLDFYRQISSQAGDYLEENGLLIYEIGYNQRENVKNLFIINGFHGINVLRDLSGHDRVLMGFK